MSNGTEDDDEDEHEHDSKDGLRSALGCHILALQPLTGRFAKKEIICVCKSDLQWCSPLRRPSRNEEVVFPT
jgi:hypothetical protein